MPSQREREREKERERPRWREVSNLVFYAQSTRERERGVVVGIVGKTERGDGETK